MAIIYQYNKKTNTTYVLEQKSHYDAEAGYSRPVRKLVGKLDPVTGEVVPTGKVGRPRKKPPTPDNSSAGLEAELEKTKLKLYELTVSNKDKDSVISSLRGEIAQLSKENNRLVGKLRKISALLDEES